MLIKPYNKEKEKCQFPLNILYVKYFQEILRNFNHCQYVIKQTFEHMIDVSHSSGPVPENVIGPNSINNLFFFIKIKRWSGGSNSKTVNKDKHFFSFKKKSVKYLLSQNALKH